MIRRDCFLATYGTDHYGGVFFNQSDRQVFGSYLYGVNYCDGFNDYEEEIDGEEQQLQLESRGDNDSVTFRCSLLVIIESLSVSETEL